MIRKLLIRAARKLVHRNGLYVVPLYVIMNLYDFEITRKGVWSHWKGDTILYYFPWQRNGFKYATILTNGCFNSLKELDKFWIEYEKAYRSADAQIDGEF